MQYFASARQAGAGGAFQNAFLAPVQQAIPKSQRQNSKKASKKSQHHEIKNKHKVYTTR